MMDTTDFGGMFLGASPGSGGMGCRSFAYWEVDTHFMSPHLMLRAS